MTKILFTLITLAISLIGFAQSNSMSDNSKSEWYIQHAFDEVKLDANETISFKDGVESILLSYRDNPDRNFARLSIEGSGTYKIIDLINLNQSIYQLSESPIQTDRIERKFKIGTASKPKYNVSITNFFEDPIEDIKVGENMLEIDFSDSRYDGEDMIKIKVISYFENVTLESAFAVMLK